jgi:predicted DCC family thiol-disulfide oxidoreductase YuxK
MTLPIRANEQALRDGAEGERGTVLYDGQCGFCSRWVRYWSGVLKDGGFGIASLDEPWVAARINMPHSELLSDIRLLTSEGRLISGADVYLYVARRIWWAWPFYAIFSLPGLNWTIHRAYRWFARNRYHISRTCRIEPR